MTLALSTPELLFPRRLAFLCARGLVLANIWTGAPLLAFWIGSQTDTSGVPSMGSIAVVVGALAAVDYALVALLGALARAEGGTGDARAAGARPPWRLTIPRSAVAEPVREPLVLIDGETGAGRPWRSVTPHLEFGFEVLAGVLPRDGSIDGTARAMDRAGWPTAHIVARPRDAGAAVELVRLGRARSLLILDSDAVAEDSVAVATAIAEFAAFRRRD